MTDVILTLKHRLPNIKFSGHFFKDPDECIHDLNKKKLTKKLKGQNTLLIQS